MNEIATALRDQSDDAASPMMADPAFDIVGICHLCANRNKTDQFKCKAFPKGIPAEIIVGVIDHTLPYPGDGGIQFTAQY